MKGESISLHKRKNTQIFIIKEEAIKLLNLEHTNYILSYKGTQLAGCRTLGYFSISNDSSLFLTDLQKEMKYSFNVVFENKNEKIEIAKCCEIEILKNEIAQKYNLEIDSFDLLYNNQLLPPSRRVGTIEIDEKALLELKVKQI